MRLPGSRRTLVMAGGVLLLISSVRLAAQSPAAPSTPSSPDVEWRTDATGRQYREEALPKSQGQKIDDTSVRTMWGVKADLAREDAEFFYIKLYRVTPVAPVTPAAAPPAAPADEPLPSAVSRLRFESMSMGLPDAGQWREGLVALDVVGDARKEIVAGPARKTLRAPSVFTWSGTAWTPATVSFPKRLYDYGDLAVATSSGDATLLAMGIHLRGLAALRLAAPGRFEEHSTNLPRAERADQAVFSSRAVVLADCNGDRRPDLIALGEGPRIGGGTPAGQSATGIAAYPAQADGSWGDAIVSERDVFGSSLTAGDVDGDGRLDLALAPARLADPRLVLRGDGACHWTPDKVPQRARAYATAVTLTPATTAARSELVVASTSFVGALPVLHLDVLRRDPNGNWTMQALLRREGRYRIHAVAAGDLDGDGHAEVVAVGPEGEATIFSGSRSGAYARETQTLTAPGKCEGSTAMIEDLDGDRRNDLVIAYAQEESAQTPGICPSEGAITAWRVAAAPAAPRTPARD